MSPALALYSICGVDGMHAAGDVGVAIAPAA
jgi:hypothetical protein